MNDLKKLVHSKELREATRASSNRWLDDSRWKPITLEEYVKYLDEIQRLKEKFNAPELPHPRMKGEKYSI